MLKTIIVAIFILTFSKLSSMPSIEEMSVEEKVGQILMVHFHGTEANEEAATLIQKLHVGGIIYYNFTNDLSSPEQTRKLSQGLQHLANEKERPIPLLIAVDQEGGLVSRVKGCTNFPGNRALSFTHKPELAENSAFIIGRELQAVGINMNLAPVVDVDSNSKNPVIGNRSFSCYPKIVTDFGEKALKGYQKANIISCIKHFPGHGDVETDSHYDLPILKKSLAELQKTELIPFAHLAPQADVVMTAHILVPALDPNHCTTLSKPSLDFLRNTLGFKKVIISDSLIMQGVLKDAPSIDDVVIQAFNAGCDILLLGGAQLLAKNTSLEFSLKDVIRIHGNLVKAVKKGEITEKRLNESVQRILALKERYALATPSEWLKSDLKDVVNTPENRHIAYEIVARATRSKKNDLTKLDKLNTKRILLVAPKLLEEAIQKSSLMQLGKQNDFFFFTSLNPIKEECLSAKSLAMKADIVVFCAYGASRNPMQSVLIKDLLATKKPMVFLALNHAADVNFVDQKLPALLIASLSHSEPSLEFIATYLKTFQDKK